MYIHLNGENHEPIIERLQQIFGIQSFSLALKVENELEAIQEAALEAMKEFDIEGKTFKVSTEERTNNFLLIQTN